MPVPGAITLDLVPDIRRSGVKVGDETLAKLTSLRVERAAGLIGRATLRFKDLGYALSAGDTFNLGTAVTISQPGGGPLLEGTVTGVNLEQTPESVPELVVVVDDAAYKLMRGTQIKTYLNGTYTQALEQLCQRHGLRPGIQTSTLTMEYLLQAGTDLAFLDTVCERLGYSWFIDANSTLVAKKLEKGAPVATLTFGEELDDFSVRASGLRPTSVSVHGWDPDRQAEVTDDNPATVSGTSPAFVRSYTGSAPAESLTASATTVADRRALTNAEAQVMAGALYDEWSAAAVVARGNTDVDHEIKPGATVRVAGAGPVSGDYLVTAVEHVYTNGLFTTRFTCGSRRPASLVDTLGPTDVDPGFAVSTLVVGVVTDAADPDNAGRVKIRYAGINGQVESPWARVVTLGGGHSRGAVFHPEVNDEVLVGFENSDTRRPVVLGGLHSKRNTLPTGEQIVANGQVNYRRITSRKNHMIELADGDAETQQHLLLKLGTREHKIRVGADRLDVMVGDGVPLTIAAGDTKFDISAAGDVTIQGKNITIKADLQLSLQAGTTLDLKGNATASLQGAQVQVKADADANVSASGPLSLKGAIVQVN